MLKKIGPRADSRALLGAVAIGSAMGLVLGASYLAGGAARAAMNHARTERLADAAGKGFSDEALLAEASSMTPGALAVARRHDPFTAPGWAQRDWETTLLAARLEQRARPEPAAPVLRARLEQPSNPADASALSSSRELDCLSAAVYYEARGESASGQAAVAQVVLNRVRSPKFPKTVCGVVFQGAHTRVCQFSFACDGSMRRTRDPVAWRRARAVAARALGGFVMQEVGNATHFHVASLGGVWGAGLMRVAQIGAHVFYKFSGRNSAHPAAPKLPAPDGLVGSPELADKPIYANDEPAADGADAPKLILASATTGAPDQAPTASDSAAEKVRAQAAATADKARVPSAGETVKAKAASGKTAASGKPAAAAAAAAAPLASAAPAAAAMLKTAS